MNDEIVVIADIEGVIRFWSAGAARAFGYPVSQAVGQSLDLLVPREHRDAHWQGFRRAMASGTASAEGMPGPFPVLHADGRISERDGRLALLRGPDETVIAAAVIYAPDKAA